MELGFIRIKIGLESRSGYGSQRTGTVRFIENSKFLEDFQFSVVLPDPASSVLTSKQLVQSGFLVHFNHNHPRYINKPKKTIKPSRNRRFRLKPNLTLTTQQSGNRNGIKTRQNLEKNTLHQHTKLLQSIKPTKH